MKLLIIEDESELLEDLMDFFKKDHFLCESATTVAEAQEKIYMYNYDAIILDIGLPDGSGLEVLKSLRTVDNNAGVLILSAYDAIEDKVSGLNLGADDYLAKPFDYNELNARIKSIIRRKHFKGSNMVVFDTISINTDSQEVHINQKLIDLTQKEYQLLIFFISNENRVITKESIVEHLWGDNTDSFDSFDFIYTHIKNLRKKIIKSGDKDYLKTVYGIGYKFQKE
ncbi:DNA-binding response regulator, OmpR family, contains REC and winged-helix (wHTH) domain [Maribacter sedimenticola]|uniref:DNA-binding response regulator, OmpR family, contains REC and winged-helix (WHTH) domain n=1 Tax=Maribacter sedimenticola TaxID=228956 RepID=A0ABY1SEX8_9FLAO|nr:MULTISPECIES: response regulator transcription factor [Maribacter]TVZ14850.1 DNA-binding response OmpR family regulator [Maribacter sp. MAR_2009_72]SNR39578.1 DNA-binding response regulator, OmpR family, contains REC and winged-helix (wHTH) domain [Maribacter sedimenticola]